MQFIQENIRTQRVPQYAQECVLCVCAREREYVHVYECMNVYVCVRVYVHVYARVYICIRKYLHLYNKYIVYCLKLQLQI